MKSRFFLPLLKNHRKGRMIINSEPFFSSDFTVSSPPWAFITSFVILNPSPVPSVPFFVVKKGWKILSLMESGMPGQLSFIVIISVLAYWDVG